VISRTIKLTAGNEPLAARLLGLGVRTSTGGWSVMPVPKAVRFEMAWA
jgi:hypothetical protein